MITDTGFNSCSCQMLPKGTVLFSSRAPIGYVAIADRELCTNQGFKSIIPNTEIIDGDFLYYLLLFNKDRIAAMGSGTTFMEVSANVMREVTVSIPSLSVQKAIASILSSIDDKIELNRRINDNLEQQAQTLFKSWFVDSAVIDDATISDYFLPNRGKNLLVSDAKGGNVPVVAGGLTPSAYHNIANTKAPVITISASGANAGFVNLWGIPVWSSDSSYIDTSITPYIYFWFNMLKFKQKSIFDSQTGSAQPHIYPKHIGDISIPDLDMNQVADFNRIVTPIYNKIAKVHVLNVRLAETRDTLLPKLMSGELNVDATSNQILPQVVEELKHTVVSSKNRDQIDEMKL